MCCFTYKLINTTTENQKIILAILGNIFVNSILQMFIGVFNQTGRSNTGITISHKVPLSPINFKLFIKIILQPKRSSLVAFKCVFLLDLTKIQKITALYKYDFVLKFIHETRANSL